MHSWISYLTLTASFFVFFVLSSCYIMASEQSEDNVNDMMLYKGTSYLDGKTGEVSLEETVNLLQQVLNRQDLSQEKEDAAKFQLAILGCYKLTQTITDDQVVQYFLQAFNSQYLSKSEKREAALGLFNMRADERTQLFTMKEAWDYRKLTLYPAWDLSYEQYQQIVNQK